jgi:hypothetical protein
MSSTLTIRDETASGQPLREWMLDVLTERIPVRDLLKSRIRQEVEDFNRSHGTTFRGLVQPTDAEATLNGFRLKRPRQLDCQPQLEKASSRK